MSVSNHLRTLSHKTFRPIRRWISKPHSSQKPDAITLNGTPVPIEVVVQILEYLWQDLQNTFGKLLYPPKQGPPPSFKEEDTRLALRTARLPLLYVTLVCRSWWEAGTPYLYSHSLLATVQQLSLFKRAVESSPAVAGSVKELSVFAHQDSGPHAHASSLVLFTSTKRVDVAQDVTSVVHECPNLRSVVLYVTHVPNTIDWFPSSVLPQNLRSLTLHYQSLTPTSFANGSFSHLRVLFLNYYTFSDYSVKVPHLPHLQILKLRSTMWWPQVSPILNLLPSQHLPALQSLYMYSNGFSIPSALTLRGLDFPRLRTVHLLGGKEVQAFETLVQCQALSAVHHLYLGTITSDDHPLGSWKLPPTLKILTVFMDFDQDASTLTPLTWFLKHNQREIETGRASLSCLVVNAYWKDYPPTTEEVEERVGEERQLLQTMTEIWNVQFEYNEIGENGNSFIMLYAGSLIFITPHRL